MSLQQVITFLNQYSVTYIDPQTSIISTNPNNNDINNSNSTETETEQNCYLLKDMLVPQNQENPQQTENNFANILQTLKSHKGLNNKYILTLLHYQVFMKNVNVPISSTAGQDFSRRTDLLSHQTSQRNSYPRNHLNKSNLHKDMHTQLYDTHSAIDSEQQLQQEVSQQLSQQILITTSVPQRAIRAVYEYTPLTLQQQIQNRKSSHTNFEEEQLWAIMATITRALTYLQSQNMIYGVLGTDKVFITHSLVKILDPSATATNPYLVEQGRLYSPQVLHHRADIDMFKSDIYVLGLMMLECGLLIDLSREVEQDLSRYLQGFKTKYSQQLVHVVEQCLANLPQDRPCFSELQEYLSRQLDMNDFSHAYEDGHIQGNTVNQKEGLACMEKDIQDHGNQKPAQIQVEHKAVQFSYDVLFERQDQQREIKIRGNTAFDRAKNKFIGRRQDQEEAEIQQGSDSSSQQEVVQERMPVRCGSPQNPLRAQSPKLHQTKRNIPKATATYTTSTFKSKSKQPYLYPSINSINAKISESVYGEQLPIHHTAGIQNQRHKDVSRSGQVRINGINNTEVILENRLRNSHQKSKQNLKTDKNLQEKTFQKQLNLPNMQKIKKTKLIKEKLIKNNQNPYHEHSFGRKSQKTLAENNYIINKTLTPQPLPKHHTREVQRITEKAMERQYFKYDHTGDSIQEELQEQSESSCLYNNYNTHASKNSKFSHVSSNHRASISQSIKSGRSGEQLAGNSSGIGSGKSSKVSLVNQNQNQTGKLNVPVLNRQRQRDLFMADNQHLFTHPNLMKTIKEDLEMYNKARR